MEIKPIIVATKIANKCHALGSSPDGAGINQMIMLTLYTMNIGRPAMAGQLFRCAAIKKFAIIYILSFRSEVS